MNSFAVLLLCVQACLVQNVFSQCCGRTPSCASGIGGAYGGYGLAAPSYGAAYGGEGIGDVSVAGQLPVTGTTLLCGQVPILGAVEFGGSVPASGDVSIAGQCNGACSSATPCAGSWASAPLATATPYVSSWAGSAGSCGAAPAFSGGALPVTSASAPPSGVSVQSENAYCGELSVCGALPFLGTVGLEGALPTAGSAAVKYGCGNGEVAMLTENIGAAGFSGYGYGGQAGPTIGRAGCGCGRAAFY